MKELSQIKPGLTGEAAKQAVFEASLTHIKYKHQGDESSTNLVAFNVLGDYAINKNGGVFTGPVQVKTTTADIVNVTAVDGVLTINLGFGKFFRVNLLAPVHFIEIINVPPNIATTFTLILVQESFSDSYHISFMSNNDKVIKYYPSDHTYAEGFVRLQPYPGHRDIVTFSTLDGTTFFLSLTGLAYSGGGNSSYGTFIRNEINYITIDGVPYANGTVDIVSDGNGGETTGTYHYPPSYPETGYVIFNSLLITARADEIFPAQYFVDLGGEPSSDTHIGNTLVVSDGQGGYFNTIVYTGSDTTYGIKDFYAYLNGVDTYLGTRTYVGDGLGHVIFNDIYEYELGDILAGPTNDFSVTFAEDSEWYSSEGFIGNFPSTVPFKGSYITKANGFSVTQEYTYPEEGTVLCSYPRLLGYAYEYSGPIQYQPSYYKSIYAPANYVADGNGNVRIEVTIQPGSFLPIGIEPSYFTSDYTQFAADIQQQYYSYSQVGCGTCVPEGLPAPQCYLAELEAPDSYSGCDSNAYVARAIYDPTQWTYNTTPPTGYGYFRLEILPQYQDNGEGSFMFYDYVVNPDNLPWVELPPL